jgi:uroporphyrinogen-III decarboxylase
MSTVLTPRERMLSAIDCKEHDAVPCAFMSFAAMRGRCQDAYDVCERELEMGLDSWLFIPSAWRNLRPNHPDLRGLPVRLPSLVRTGLWMESLPGEEFPVFRREYRTPAGILTTVVRKTHDWPHGNFVPFLDDYQIPRAIKPLVTGRADLEPLQLILQPPGKEDVAAFHTELRRAKAFCAEHGIMLAGGWSVGGDMAAWLCGLESLVMMTADQPDLVEALLEIIGEWSLSRMRVACESGIDLYIRRGWYETADFWSPGSYRRFIFPWLRREAEMAHEYGVRFGYNLTTGALPILGHIVDSGADVLIGCDPLQRGQRPLETMRDTLDGRVCMWGGINGAITVEEGTEEDVREAVREALEMMRGVEGFILSPVDNITEITQRAWSNVDALIRAWRQFRSH